ncbi:MAG TPA: hypothetical protein VFJ56_01240, partial [Nitrospira sp.]|nr:hypothetical protein [Nitrospira sp.]
QPLESFPFARTYIKATRDDPGSDAGYEARWRAARHAKESSAWRYYEIETNHMVATNRPEELAQILAGRYRLGAGQLMSPSGPFSDMARCPT